MVVVSRLSKLVHFIPTVDTASAEAVARLFVDNVFVPACHARDGKVISFTANVDAVPKPDVCMHQFPDFHMQ